MKWEEMAKASKPVSLEYVRSMVEKARPAPPTVVVSLVGMILRGEAPKAAAVPTPAPEAIVPKEDAPRDFAEGDGNEATADGKSNSAADAEKKTPAPSPEYVECFECEGSGKLTADSLMTPLTHVLKEIEDEGPGGRTDMAVKEGALKFMKCPRCKGAGKKIKPALA